MLDLRNEHKKVPNNAIFPLGLHIIQFDFTCVIPETYGNKIMVKRGSKVMYVNCYNMKSCVAWL
jgi:hypothetical protein